MKQISEEAKVRAIHYLAKKLQEKKLKEYGLEVNNKGRIKTVQTTDTGSV